MWGFSNFNNLWPRDFLNVSEPFQEEYTCYPVSFIGKDDMENGNKIILPQTALNALARRHISWPMLFEVSNPYTDKRTHSGVLEFISDEGTCHMPYWMMQQLNLKEGDIVRVTSVSLPKGTFVKLKPCSKDFMELSNHRAVLETALRNYATLTIGDNIVIHYLGKTYEIKIVDLKPAFACTIIETDVEVEFEEPIDHSEPVQYVTEIVPEEENKFKGKGQRTDGKSCHKALKKEIIKPKVVENLEPWKDKLAQGIRVIRMINIYIYIYIYIYIFKYISTGESYCINEINNLMECSRSPDPSMCSKEFVLFRECNRPDGPHILIEDNKYVISKEHLDKYNVSESTISPIEAPQRNNSNTASFLEKMKEVLHLKNFKEKFVAYKW
ncbi:hypothetical protein PFFCH_03374 [Plasmodium falciparum FCH/4]|uniref:Ubiquitin fusion degradation protein UFD1 n=1 Tax=Plasmodium falciparum FCH/4 TaxID=1036724 RepID=A0A024VKB8_PLAFA|nr:hypothetical protein PFFCH_03374 [Plasmodium falciparum FCH/4]